MENQKSQLKQRSVKNRFVMLLLPILLVFAITLIINFVFIQVEINQKNSELARLEAQIEAVELDNQRLNRYLKADYREEYIENTARDELGYARPEERIYYIIPID